MPTTAGSLLTSAAGSAAKEASSERCAAPGASLSARRKPSNSRSVYRHFRAARYASQSVSSADTVPGGSSSGSAVAVAAGLCLAIGSDTRSVACRRRFGLFGLKTTAGLWPLDGVFSLAPHLDALGLLTHSAADAAIAFAQVSGGGDIRRPPDGVRFGRPRSYFFEELDAQVARRTEAAIRRLAEAGAQIVDIDIAEAAGAKPISRPCRRSHRDARARRLRARARMDRIVAARAATGLLAGCASSRNAAAAARQAPAPALPMSAWIMPTTMMAAPPCAPSTIRRRPSRPPSACRETPSLPIISTFRRSASHWSATGNVAARPRLCS